MAANLKKCHLWPRLVQVKQAHFPPDDFSIRFPTSHSLIQTVHQPPTPGHTFYLVPGNNYGSVDFLPTTQHPTFALILNADIKYILAVHSASIGTKPLVLVRNHHT
jgi:hypothetical protein